LIRSGVFKHVLQSNFRVMVAKVVDSLLPILDRFLGAQLDARHALFASMKPRRFSIGDLDIGGRAHLRTDSAVIAFIVHPETLVHFRHLLE
jgi:hypothetical protein